MIFKLGDYEVQEKIGEGGSSDVFRGIRLGQQQVVAIKLLHAKYCEDKGMRERLLRESKVIGRLAHPNVVRIFDSGSYENRIYVVLQYLNRGSLSNFAQMNERDRLKTMIQVCDGAAFIHSQGIVHRDLKPSNIMFGDDEIPRLVDFGISLFNEEEHTRLTHTNMVMGTLSYMSPEQQSAPGKVDLRSDIYSLGAILYEIFTNRKPIGRFQNPCDMLTNFDKRLETVILRAMAHNPDDRFQSVKDMQHLLLALWKDGLFETGSAPVEGFDGRIGYWLAKLEDRSLGTRMQAREQIEQQVLVEDVPRLIRICEASSKDTRAALIPILGKLKDPRAKPFLLSQIGDPMLTRSVCYALTEIGGEDAIKALLQLVKAKLVYSYYALVPLVLLSRDANLKYVLPFLKSSSYAERGEALKAMELASSKRFLSDLKKYLKQETEKELINRAYILVQRLEQG